MTPAVKRHNLSWAALLSGTVLVAAAVITSTPDSSRARAANTTVHTPISTTTTTNPLNQQLVPLDTRTVRYAITPESEPLERVLPTSDDATELLNADAAITVDGPVNAAERIAGWLRGWRTEHSEVLLAITTHPTADAAETFARKNTGRRAHEFGNGEPSPRNWTLPAAEQLWVEADTDMARIVARYDTDVIVVVAHTPDRENPPVALVAALVARTQTRLAPSPAPKRRGRIDQAAIELSWTTAELIPRWINGMLPTRGSLYRISGNENRCLAYDNTDRYSPGTWIRTSC